MHLKQVAHNLQFAQKKEAKVITHKGLSLASGFSGQPLSDIIQINLLSIDFVDLYQT